MTESQGLVDGPDLPTTISGPTNTVRRFRFRLRTMLLLVTLAAIAMMFPKLRRAYHGRLLQEFVGRDLQQLSEAEAERFQHSIEIFLGDSEHMLNPTNSEVKSIATAIPFVPRILDEGSDHQLILVESSYSIIDHGKVTNRVSVFNWDGRLCHRQQIAGGWFGMSVVQFQRFGDSIGL